ncbi:hypothetical protein GBZ48_19220 [Azospirillum melinis]|uniref:Tetratricopeptide repeat protein n=1 Tax=Azospirillum melinis TaxID=328839 RepID=A0ABX2KJF3_9PROT|nr:tetratricopeptide repeat protein [Azospirillum melinis]MBP2307292.1 putative Zn-dependent protease [Azospirillum melinis]NUB01394.1 hypothetical protein [Azospirillum melinis]
MVLRPVPSNVDIEAWRQRIRDTTLANYHFHMGYALQRGGETSAAASAYSRALAAQPDHSCAAFMLVQLATAAGDLAWAATVDQAARRHDPAYDAWAVAELVLNALELGECEKAETIISMAAGNALEAPAVRLASAAVASQDGNLPLAARTLTGIAAADLKHMDRLAKTPLMQLTHNLMSAAELDLAGMLLAAFGQIVDHEPMLIFIRAVLARCRGALVEAETDLKSLSVQGWSPTMVRLTYAALLLTTGRGSDAERLVAEVLTAEPNHPSATGIQALIRLGDGDDAAAEALLGGRDFSLRPATDAWLSMATIVLLSRYGRHVEAEALTRSLIATLGPVFDLVMAAFPLSAEAGNVARYAAAVGHPPRRWMNAQ